MHSDLVKRLREGAISADSGNEISESLYRDILQAADAIENLELTCNKYEKDYKNLCAYLLNCGLKLSKPEPLREK